MDWKFLFLTGHIQISQVPDRSEPDDNGEINYKYIFKLLQRLGYSQWIGCEYTPTLGKKIFLLFCLCIFSVQIKSCDLQRVFF